MNKLKRADHISNNSWNDEREFTFDLNVPESSQSPTGPSFISYSDPIQFADYFGTLGNDVLTGSAGDDTFYPMTGTDTIDGGDGFDTVTYDGNVGRIQVIVPSSTISIRTSGADNILGAPGTAINIESIIGGSGDDFFFITNTSTFTGDFAFNGGAGDDTILISSSNANIVNLTLAGGDGDDFLGGGLGLDSFDGGNGVDRVSFFNLVFGLSRESAIVDMRIDEITNDGFGNTETLINVEDVGGGSYLIDTFHGNDSDNVLYANFGGADNLHGHGGDDILIIVDAGGVIDGGLGNDGLGFFDTRYLNQDADFDGLHDSEMRSAGVDVNLATGQIISDGFGGSGTFSNIENLGGTGLADALVGDANANEFLPGEGDDFIDGGAGIDTLVFEGTDISNYLVNDNGDGSYLVQDLVGNEGINTVVGIEFLRVNEIDYDITTLVSPFGPGNDVYVGDATDEILNSLAGNDIVDGAGGNDTIDGGEGDDQLSGGDGNDTINSGLGVDSVNGGNGNDNIILGFDNGDFDYGESYDGGLGIDTITVSSGVFFTSFAILDLGAGTFTDQNGTATFANFENFNSQNYTGFTNLTVVGTAGINIISLGNSSGQVFAGAGDDIIIGSLGYDSLTGGAGADIIDGYFGFAQAEYTLSPSAVFIDLDNGTASGGDAEGDILTSITGLVGSAFDDTLIANSAASAFSVLLFGGGGNDTLVGGAGSDSLSGGEGDDMLDGLDGDDILFGDSGDDIIIGGLGDDIIDGGVGVDTASYADASSAVAIDLTLVNNQDTLGSGFDRLSGIENLTGSAFDDILTGDAAANEIDGGAGFDTLSGGDGDDTLVGGTQNDLLNGDGGNDILLGGLGADILNGGDGNDLLLGGNRNDTLDGGAGNDRTFGGNADDTVMGGAGDDILRGGDQNDSLDGGEGNGFLFGGTGIDNLMGGSGNDILSGRGGFDVLNGGEGDDILTGGFNADVFVFEGAFGNDIITDYAATSDAEDIDLSGVASIVNFTDLLNNHATQVGADVVIDDLLGNTITLQNVDISDLNVADFIF